MDVGLFRGTLQERAVDAVVWCDVLCNEGERAKAGEVERQHQGCQGFYTSQPGQGRDKAKIAIAERVEFREPCLSSREDLDFAKSSGTRCSWHLLGPWTSDQTMEYRAVESGRAFRVQVRVRTLATWIAKRGGGVLSGAYDTHLLHKRDRILLLTRSQDLTQGYATDSTG